MKKELMLINHDVFLEDWCEAREEIERFDFISSRGLEATSQGWSSLKKFFN
jgi:hypothetical protein